MGIRKRLGCDEEQRVQMDEPDMSSLALPCTVFTIGSAGNQVPTSRTVYVGALDAEKFL